MDWTMYWLKDTWRRRGRAGTTPRWCSSPQRAGPLCSTALWSDTPLWLPPWSPPATGTLGSSATLQRRGAGGRGGAAGRELVCWFMTVVLDWDVDIWGKCRCAQILNYEDLLRFKRQNKGHKDDNWIVFVDMATYLTYPLLWCTWSPAAGLCPWEWWEACNLCGHCSSWDKRQSAKSIPDRHGRGRDRHTDMSYVAGRFTPCHFSGH